MEKRKCDSASASRITTDAAALNTDYVPSAEYTKEDWDEVSDNPPLTAEELAGLRRGPEGLPPDLAAAFQEAGSQNKGPSSVDKSPRAEDPDFSQADARKS